MNPLKIFTYAALAQFKPGEKSLENQVISSGLAVN